MYSMRLWGFPSSSDGKESACNAGSEGLIPEVGKSLEKGMDRGAWQVKSIGLQRVEHN